MYQCCATSKTRLWILLHFQLQINVIWTVTHIAKTTLIQSWNVGRVVSLRKLILRNILPATLLTKWNIKVFFKYYTTTFTTPVFANFFWWLLLNFFFPSGFSFMNIHTSKDCRGRGGYFFNSSLPRFRLGLVVSNSSGLQLVSS